MASLLRGVLSMPTQHDASTVQLLSQAHGLLPEKLPDVSTAILTELIKSTAKQLSTLQQKRLTPSHSHAAAAASAGPVDNSISTGSAWGGSLLTQRDQQQMELVLAGMLQECVAEWSSAQRVGDVTCLQAAAVAGVLESSGQQDLAAAARQVRARTTAHADAACVCWTCGFIQRTELQDVPTLYGRRAVIVRTPSDSDNDFDGQVGVNRLCCLSQQPWSGRACLSGA
jgi:hypothetical protein